LKVGAVPLPEPGEEKIALYCCINIQKQGSKPFIAELVNLTDDYNDFHHVAAETKTVSTVYFIVFKPVELMESHFS